MEQIYLIITYTLAGILGLCFGSFLNVLVYRLPRGMSIAMPPSHCVSCGARVRWYDNVPVLSYLLLCGRCRDCGARISPRYPLVELANCLLWMGSVAWFFPRGVGMVAVACVACSALIVVFCTDLETMLIPDSMLVVLGLCGIAALLLDVFGLGVGIGWQARLIGTAAGFGFFLLLFLGCRLLKGEAGLGFGDVKLMTAAGLLVGWQGLLVAALFGSVAAAVTMAIRAALHRGARETAAGEPPREHAARDDISGAACGEGAEPASEPSGRGEGAAESVFELSGCGGEERDGEVPSKAFPFAPFLAAATAVALFFGQNIVDWYLGLFF